MIRELFWATVAALAVTAPVWIPALAHGTTLNNPVNVCAALRDGISLGNIETALEATGLTPTAAVGYAGTVVRTQCPELIGLVMGQVV